VVTGDDVDWLTKLCQDIGHFQDEHTVHTVILEDIPSYEDELGVGAFGSLHNAARSGQPLIAHTLADWSYMDSFHANLPVGGVEEFHGIALLL